MNSFTQHQFGFLPGRSTLQQLILFTEKLLNGINNKNEVDVIYMDFKKAFDSVSHNALLSKLQALGIPGRLWFWLETSVVLVGLIPKLKVLLVHHFLF